MEKRRVYLIFGGRSGEHEVSLMSAKNVMDALDKTKYEVVPIGITKEGQWLLSHDPLKSLTEGVEKTGGLPVGLVGDPTHAELVSLEGGKLPDQLKATQADAVFFPVLHGTYGEDGTLQGLLELANVPYVGCGVLASSAGMDKAISKQLFLHAGLQVAQWQVYLRKEWESEPERVAHQIEAFFGKYPVFVKPVNMGSSVGISKASDREGLVRAMNEAARFDRRILVEEAIAGKEIEVAVLGNDDPKASVPGEIIPGHDFYDYEAKYFDDKSSTLVPANLPADVAEEVRRQAVLAFKALDAAGLSRCDFFVEHGTNRILINEVNTIPGFTRISMYPKLWEATGIGYSELCDRLIELALERHADKSRNTTSV